MAHTDSISDMLTRIRNAIKATHETVDIPASKIKIKLAELLQKEGYIRGFELINKDKISKLVRIYLKYGPRGEKLMIGIKRVSKPGLKVYSKSKDIPRVLGGLGISIISTSQGLKTDREARKENIGGEVICSIW